MADCETIFPASDGELHVIVAAQHILKALRANKNVTDDLRKILADLDIHLSTMSKLGESKESLTCEFEDQLKGAQEKVMRWQSNRLMIWEIGAEELSEFLQAVDEVRRLTESLGCLLSSKNGKQRELLDRAYTILQIAMARLETELIHILSQNKQLFGSRFISIPSYREGVACEESVVSTEDEAMEETSRKGSSGTESEEWLIDLVHPDVLSYIKAIATVMFASNYDREFCQAFTAFWKDSLDEYLFICNVEKFSIEDVLKMEWESLSGMIRKWCKAMKNIIGLCLPSMKWLFDQVLGEFESVGSICFVEASKASMLCLLNFGEAISIGPRLPERLFCLIEMYEVVSELRQNIDDLFSEELGSFVRTEFHELLRKLGDSARVTFLGFGHQIASNASVTPIPKGDIHPLTRYVMNYLMTLTAGYGDTLNLLLEGQDGGGLGPLVNADDGPNAAASCNFHPVASYLWSVASMLETNLDAKSRLYGNCSLKNIFMMNNIHYIVEKVKDSQLSAYFGDQWIREHIVKFQKHETGYERATWSPVLSFLRDDGNRRKAVLRERCRNFNIAFENVYKSQSGWIIPDPRLREDLRISISQKVIHAYRTFTGRFSTCIGDKYIRFTEDNLGNLILDLFEGSPRPLHTTRRW